MDNERSSPTLTNVTFRRNSGGNCGGMFNQSGSSPTLTNVTFDSNSGGSAGSGGMLNNLSSNPTLANVTFSGNSATYSGGGMGNWQSSSPTLTNVTFSGNSATYYGGGMYNSQSSSPNVRNTILWGNTASTGPQIYNDASSAPTVSACVVQGGYTNGTNIITADPKLGTLGNYGGSTQTIPLLPGSSAIDAGNAGVAPTTDQRGASRVGAPDIGAFESQGFVLAITGGNNQSAPFNTAFAQALAVSVTANNAGEPVNGGAVTFTPPATGASATFGGSNPATATIASGAASVNATANGVGGSYQVAASAAGANAVNFNLTNTSPAPTVASITPSSGLNNGTVNITNLAGTGFLAGATVKLTKSGQSDIAGTSVTVVSGTQITCTFDLTGKTVGQWNVVVTNTDTQSATLTNGFTVTNPSPTVTSITPNSGVNTGSVNITNLAGTGFLAGATVKLTMSGQADINATSVSVVNSTQITCSFDLTGKTAGQRNVVVTNTDTQSATLTNGFTVTNPSPTVTSITPNSGVNTGSVNITNLAGTGFLAGATVKLTMSGQADINATSVNVVSSTQITCAFDLTGKAAGQWNVVVTNTDTQTGTLANGFTVTNPAPTVTAITPNTGVNSGSINITNLAGTGFLAGATVKLMKSGEADISGTTVSVVSATQITCVFDLTGKAAGQWNVVVTNTDGQSGTLTNGFTITNPAPTVTSITPASGLNTGTVNITNLAGTGFLAGATVKLTKSGQVDISGTTVSVVSSTQITCAFDLTGKAAGQWNVVVTNTDTQTGTLANGFTITNPAPPTATVTIGIGGNQFSLVSLPDVPSGFNPFAGLLDSNRDSYLVRWNCEKTSDPVYFRYEYLIYGGSARTDLLFSQVETGRGYCRKASAAYTGSFASRTSTFDVPLYRSTDPYAYWNLIGVPYTSSVELGSVQIIAGGVTRSFADAVTAGIVDGFAWRYKGPTTGYELISYPGGPYAGVDTKLDPGLGYWLHVLQDCTLRFIPPGTSPPGPLSAVRSDGWSVRLNAQAGGFADNCNFFGTDDVGCVLAKPPLAPDGGYVVISFLGQDATLPREVSRQRERAAGMILRSDVRATNSWLFSVETNLSQPVQLSWANLDQVPKGVFLYLTDLTTQQRIAMTADATYVFNLGPQGGVRYFRITAEPSDGQQTSAVSVTDITPDGGTNDRTVTAQVSGAGFAQGASVRLTRVGQDDIVAAEVKRVSAARLVCKLDLKGKATGKWDVSVTNPDGQGGRLAEGFTIVDASTATHDVAITQLTASPNPVNRGETLTLAVAVKNNGTAAERGVKVSLTVNGQPLIRPVIIGMLNLGQEVSGNVKIKIPKKISTGDSLITAEVAPVKGETNTDNNRQTVKVTVK